MNRRETLQVCVVIFCGLLGGCISRAAEERKGDWTLIAPSNRARSISALSSTGMAEARITSPVGHWEFSWGWMSVSREGRV